MKQFFGLLISSLAIAGVGVLLFTSPIFAQTIGEGGAIGGIDAARGTGVPTNFANGDSSIITRMINYLLYAIGVISVVMLILGGFKYVVSGGDSSKVTSSKNTILYAIVGLLIAIFAYPIIKFVIDIAVGGGNSTNV